MKKMIIKGYFLTISFFIILLFGIFFNLFSDLELFYNTTLDEIDLIKSSYTELTKFEESYIEEQNTQKYLYINNKYLYLEEKIDNLSKTLTDRELIFLLNEIKESLLKHKESFFRCTIYIEDVKIGGDSDLYYIENFNLQKSIELFQGQYNSFTKRTEKFIVNLGEFYQNEKLIKEKQGFSIFSIILFLMTLALKYILIWGENNGRIDIIKENKGKKIKNFFN